MTLAGQGRKFLTFAAVGLVGTSAHYATLAALVEGFAADPVPASVAGFLVGAMVNYVLNYKLTFHSAKKHREAATKFLTVAGTGLILNAGLMAIFVDLLHIPYFLAQIIVTGFLLFWHYTLNAIWTFR